LLELWLDGRYNQPKLNRKKKWVDRK
jgi:hypothetical protein